jgi:hypothetical protein
MSRPTGHAPDDGLLVRYLIGSLAGEEAEPLDELSIADDQFAFHLSEVENDLVDAYVRGELSGETLDRFRSHYLSSPTKREKVRFAQTFLAYQKRAATAPANSTPARRWFSLFRMVPQWELAAAALLVLTAAGYVFVENLRLRNQVAEARVARSALEQREEQLQKELTDRRSADADTTRELARVREALAQIEGRTAANQRGGGTVLSFVLLPATRGASDLATIVIPPGTDEVRLQLALESDDFSSYRVVLKDPAIDRILWRSADLKAVGSGAMKSVAITIRASLLKPQNYSLELTGVPAHGAAELVGSYPFRGVLE